MKDFLRWLSMAHNQPAILSQRVVEAAHHMLRGCWGEVDQHVAAENQIQVGRVRQRRRIIGASQVEIGEGHALADAGEQREGAAFLGEICRLKRWWRLPERPGAIDALLCPFQRVLVDVGSKEQHVPVRQIRQQPFEQDRQRVRLFAGGTARTPNTELAHAALSFD